MIKIVSLGLVCTLGSAASAVAISAMHDLSHGAAAAVQVAHASSGQDERRFVIPSHVSAMPVAAVETDAMPTTVETAQNTPVAPDTFEPVEVVWSKSPATGFAQPVEATPAVMNVSFGTRTMGATLTPVISRDLDYVIGVYR